MSRVEDPAPEDLLPLNPAAFHILAALAESDCHGYAIMQDVAERTGGRTRLNPGTLYTSIRRLLEQGLIVELEERAGRGGHDERRRRYRLTSFGRRVAELELQRLGELVSLGRHAGLALKRS
jgi:DNA-binding PadR family transcriptional regulator